MTGGPQLAGFDVQRLLGRGNSAWVHLALDGRGRRVALKLPFPETLADPQRAERFANEVRLSLQLRHDHLVVGFAGTPFGAGSYLSMRYFPEGTLSRWLELGKLSAAESWRILADVAGALSALHQQGVVHQDVKSQNIYLDDGRAALGDFGAAYFVTQGGKTAGSPFYMAPEIYRAEGSTRASDVYSLGVLAYETLTLHRPFGGHSYEELMAAHLSRYPRPLAGQLPDLPRPVAQLVERALAKNPAERPEAAELARAFELALGASPKAPGKPAPAEPPRPAPVGRHGPVQPAPVQPAPVQPAPVQPAAETPVPPGTGWNPFKRRPKR